MAIKMSLKNLYRKYTRPLFYSISRYGYLADGYGQGRGICWSGGSSSSALLLWRCHRHGARASWKNTTGFYKYSTDWLIIKELADVYCQKCMGIYRSNNKYGCWWFQETLAIGMIVQSMPESGRQCIAKKITQKRFDMFDYIEADIGSITVCQMIIGLTSRLYAGPYKCTNLNAIQ